MLDKPRTLDAIGFEAGTDKSSRGHDFLRFYEDTFAHLRDEAFLLLEIGVYTGQSLETWGRYFEQATIVGIDIDPAAAEYNKRDNTHVHIGDASLLETHDKVVVEFGRPLIVVDDGSHYWHHQIESLRYLCPASFRAGLS